MKRVWYSVIVFVITMLISVSLDTIGYYVIYVPEDHYSYSQYFIQNELLISAMYIAILTTMVFNLFIWERK